MATINDIQTQILTPIANAIRTKEGSTEKIPNSQLASRIENLQTSSGGGEIVEEELLQLTINNQNSSPKNISRWFQKFSGENADFLKKYDFSKVGIATSLFANCPNLKILEIPESFSSVTTFNYLANNCPNLEIVRFLYDTTKISNLSYAFEGCVKLTTIENLNLIGCYTSAYLSSPFSTCYKLTNLNIFNIKVDLQISNGSSWGHLLTLESLIGIVKELINAGSARKLTMGSANLSKIASTYVKFVDSSQTSIATNEKGDVVVCESTDEGAMLVSDYAALKNWTLA